MSKQRGHYYDGLKFVRYDHDDEGYPFPVYIFCKRWMSPYRGILGRLDSWIHELLVR